MATAFGLAVQPGDRYFSMVLSHVLSQKDLNEPKTAAFCVAVAVAVALAVALALALAAAAAAVALALAAAVAVAAAAPLRLGLFA